VCGPKAVTLRRKRTRPQAISQDSTPAPARVRCHKHTHALGAPLHQQPAPGANQSSYRTSRCMRQHAALLVWWYTRKEMPAQHPTHHQARNTTCAQVVFKHTAPHLGAGRLSQRQSTQTSRARHSQRHTPRPTVNTPARMLPGTHSSLSALRRASSSDAPPSCATSGHGVHADEPDK
jgi:hypothetical protein